MVYNLSDLTKLIYRKNNNNKIDYVIKLLKETNVKLENYRKEAEDILSIENIINYSLFIDKEYLNKIKIKKICANCNKYHYGCKNHSNNFLKMYSMKNFEKIIVTIFQKFTV